jgi:hypothetical protein
MILIKRFGRPSVFIVFIIKPIPITISTIPIKNENKYHQLFFKIFKFYPAKGTMNFQNLF